MCEVTNCLNTNHTFTISLRRVQTALYVPSWGTGYRLLKLRISRFYLSSSTDGTKKPGQSPTILVMVLALVTSVFSGIVILAHWLGLFDRPNVEDVAFILPSRRRLFAILATSTTDPNSRDVYKLEKAAKTALETNPKSRAILSKAAFIYGVPDYNPTSSCVGCAVYFEEHGFAKPRWGRGLLIGVDTWSEAKTLLKSLSTKGCNYPIRVMDLGMGPVKKGRIKWRNNLTPIIARYLHWNRAFVESISERDVVECEIYVVGAHEKGAFIDYLLIDADSTTVWNASGSS